MENVPGQEPTQPTGQEPQGTPPAPTTPQAQDTPKTYDEAYVKKLRDEAASYRTKLKTFEDAQLSEADRLKQQAKEASDLAAKFQADLRTERTNGALSRAAQAAQIPLEVATSMIAVEYDEQGNITTDLEAAARGIATRYPGLVTGASSGSPTQPDRGRSATGTFTTSQINDRSFWEANRDAIMAAMREGRVVEG